MAKKKSWFNILKRLFTRETQSKPEKEKRRKWMFGKLKIKRLASLSAPSAVSLGEADEDQSKSALTLALTTIPAAEAAVATVQAAAEVLHQHENEKEEPSVTKVGVNAAQFNREILEFAATKIQTSFRGYLARKALRALKGIVKLQAIIRGRAVRRQAITTLKCLQSIINIQTQACTRRFEMAEADWKYDRSKQMQSLRDKIIRMDLNSQRRWDDSILSKEDGDALYLSKKVAMIKRERIKDYAFTHRKSAESERKQVNGRWRYWLDQWVDTQVAKSRELEDLDTIATSKPRPREDHERRQPKLRNIRVQNNSEGLDSPVSFSRRSFHHGRQCSVGDDNSMSSSSVVPTYMAATESAKAKARSTSCPKVRTRSFDTRSGSYSPCKNQLSLTSSVTAETPSTGRIGRSSCHLQKSPRLKGLAGAVKSSRIVKDLSFDLERSLHIWDRSDGSS